jgi:zinc and cadmium transporter
MDQVWLYTLASVFIVSLIAFIGIFTLSIQVKRLRSILIYVLSFSAGALLGDAFIHLLPEASEHAGFNLAMSVSVIGGVLVFFILEKLIHWQHCHMPIGSDHAHPFAYMNLVGDGLHNFIDGLIIGASYLIDIPTGVATTIAVVIHEIPQEIGDFGVLLHGGFSKTQALMLNFVTALTAVVGAVLALWLGGVSDAMVSILVPFAAGGFIYIAGSDLIPELHKETKVSRSILQLLAFVAGIAVMLLLLLLE